MPAKTAKTRFAKKVPVRDLVITRVFDAPLEMVWRHFTEPDLVKRWWGPEGYTAPSVRIDLRVGGESLFCMRSPEGQEIWSKGVYREVVPMERIVTTDSFADEKGNVVPATYYGMSSDFPLELLITMTFKEYGGKTEFILKHSGMPSGPDLDGARTGWNQSFDKLDDSLRGST